MADNGYLGQPPSAGTVQFNADSANIMRLLARVETAALVQVIAVTTSSTAAPIGTVDVQNLVHQVDGYGNAVPHGTIYALPYARIQAGSSAIILDPAVGDQGVAVFASRDTSSVRRSKAPSLPGSGRKHDPADGIYLFTANNGVTPTQFLRVSATDGIEMVSPIRVHIQTPSVDITGNLTVSGTTNGEGDGVFEGTSVHTHVNTGVKAGSDDSGPPA